MKATIIFLFATIAAVGAAKSQEIAKQGTFITKPGVHIKLQDASTSADLPIVGGAVLFIMGSDTTSILAGKDGIASYTKRVTTPTIEIVAKADGFMSHSSKLTSPSPGQAVTRTIHMRKPKN